MQTIWLMRHADRLDFIQPEWFETALYPYDPPLAPSGLDLAIALAQDLSWSSIEQILTSPFLRTIQTAAPLARRLQLPIQLEWGLCEWLCQDWTLAFPATTPIDELMRDYPNIDRNYQSLVLPCYPETSEALDARIHIIAHKLVQSNFKNILAIAHKGSVLGIAAALTGDANWRTHDLPCGGMIKLVLVDSGQWTVECKLSTPLLNIVDRHTMPQG
jgi:broad specificity phosphatase PhoE